MEPTPDNLERPSKRLRLNQRAPSSPPAAHTAAPPLLEDLGDVSEDTDGSVPASPNHHPGMSQDDDFGQEQVTVCKWEGCDAGDVENMDNLVEHLHEDHIGTRQKKYSCEWSDCTRKGIPHASGYALRAHMRSHTREKPFYCTLPGKSSSPLHLLHLSTACVLTPPECDRSFTRSDALAKHMRTVHETEALRPSDPVPKHHSSNPSNKFQRIKLVLSGASKPSSDRALSTPASPPAHPSAPHIPTDADYAHNNVTYVQDLAAANPQTMVQFPPDLSFTPAELALPADALFHSLRRTLLYATEEGERLRKEADALEKLRKQEWDRKEVLFENYMEMQLSTAKRDRLERGEPDIEGFEAAEGDVAPSRKLKIHPVDGRVPWWRDEWESKVARPVKAEEHVA